MKSFLQGKKTLSIPPLRPLATAPASLAGATLRPSASSPACGTGGTPTVDVVREGDKIVRLVITCTCGERTEIECLYPAGS
jgi:hypothetical protein